MAMNDALRVGDEVAYKYFPDSRYIVTKVDGLEFRALSSCGIPVLLSMDFFDRNFIKTGRHNDKISEVLEWLKEGKHD